MQMHNTSLETARLGSTTLPSTLCGRADMAASTSCTDEYVTKPKPLDLLLFGSLMTLKRPAQMIDTASNQQTCVAVAL